MITIILSIALVEFILIFILINKYRTAQKRCKSWKGDYYAIKQNYEYALSYTNKLKRDFVKSDHIPKPDTSTWAKVKI